MNELIEISPESLDVANTYLVTGSLVDTANQLCVPPDQIAKTLEKREVKAYIDQVYLDQGYRNRQKLGAVLDMLIEKKLEEAEETELYTDKDLADLIQQAHKMRMDELKLQKESAPKVQINQQNNTNPFGEGNYGKLIQDLLKPEK